MSSERRLARAIDRDGAELADLRRAIVRAALECNRTFREDVLAALVQRRATETSRLARAALSLMIENAGAAEDSDLPLCQDTSQFVVFLDVGTDVQPARVDIRSLVRDAILDAAEEGGFRSSVVDDPLVRLKRGNDPVVHIDLKQGGSSVTVAAVGCGGENMSRLQMFRPGANWDDISDFVIESARLAGAKPCPPTVVGIGVGGDSESAMLMAKRSLFLPIGSRHPSMGDQESALLSRLNAEGIGVHGFGGESTCLDVHVRKAPCHMATLPVAVCFSCYVGRWRTVEFDSPFDLEEQLRRQRAEPRTRESNDASWLAEHVDVELTTPVEEGQVGQLRAGQLVSLSGKLLVARDAAHRRMLDGLNAGQALPFDPRGSAVYYAAPSPRRNGAVGSIGPTTSARMDEFTEPLLKQGVRITLGKGERDPRMASVFARHGAAYLVAIGGTGAAIAEHVIGQRVIAYDELGCEAVLEIEVRNLPAIVVIDTTGNDLYKHLHALAACHQPVRGDGEA